MQNRKKVAFGAVALGTTLTLASAAFACTTYKGKMTVRNENTAIGGTSEAIGSGSGMNYCQSPTGGAEAHPGVVGEDVVVVSVSPQATGCVFQLPDRLYKVNFVNYGKVFSKGKFIDKPAFTISGTTYTRTYDCMTPNDSGVVNISGGHTMNVVNGSATGTYTIPTSTTNGTVRSNTAGTDASGVCVSDNGAFNGNQAPLHIVVL